ncbi:hypothetical protein SRHO_G00064220 [Serrasalmus rhombeus]
MSRLGQTLLTKPENTALSLTQEKIIVFLRSVWCSVLQQWPALLLRCSRVCVCPLNLLFINSPAAAAAVCSALALCFTASRKSGWTEQQDLCGDLRRVWVLQRRLPGVTKGGEELKE